MNQGPDNTASLSELQAVYTALDRVQGIIEFELDGTIIKANDNFLSVVGYAADEVIGKHHRIFCDPQYAASPEYAEFWRRLGAGEYAEAEFKRRTKSGDEVWLRASYNPVFGGDGKPNKVVKFASDITQSKLDAAEHDGMIRAINRVQAVIEFELDGTVMNANENFLKVFGYSLDEVVGKHHRMFCDPSYAESAAYKDLWKALGQGEFKSGEFRRMHKNGTEIWLQASYNPIFDADGRPWKIVKFASDITKQVEARSLAMLEMSTPVAEVWEDILMLPIVGTMDSKRAQDIMSAVLTKIGETHSRSMILDIGGVAVMDTAVANHLIKISKAARLMGSQCIISGLSPAIAQTMIELGINVGDVRTTATLRDALAVALENAGVEISKS